ncbi:Purine nucleoside phosphorylase [Xanthoria parietina]
MSQRLEEHPGVTMDDFTHSSPDTLSFKHANEAHHFIAKQLSAELQSPRLGIICGSGLGGLAETVLSNPRHEIPYSAIPHFPLSSVHGHAGKLVIGVLRPDESPVVFMVGRIHYYEGHSFQSLTFPVRVLKLLGVDTLLITNAAGGLNPRYSIGDFVLLKDHLNLAGLAGNHPLRGPNLEDFGVRFPALSDAYDLHLRRRAHEVWRQVDRHSDSRQLHEGTYAFVGGPSYETRAECRMLRNLGADLVGMSTVPEIIVARHCGIRVLALSLVTNNAVLEPGLRGDDTSIKDLGREDLTRAIATGKANHEEVLKSGEEAAKDLQSLLNALMVIIKTEDVIFTTKA